MLAVTDFSVILVHFTPPHSRRVLEELEEQDIG
jgi:hypothetical protein